MILVDREQLLDHLVEAIAKMPAYGIVASMTVDSAGCVELDGFLVTNIGRKALDRAIDLSVPSQVQS